MTVPQRTETNVLNDLELNVFDVPKVELVYHVRRFPDLFGRKLTGIVLNCDPRLLDDDGWLYRDRSKVMRKFIGKKTRYPLRGWSPNGTYPSDTEGDLDSIEGWAFHVSRLYYKGILVYREIDRGLEKGEREREDE